MSQEGDGAAVVRGLGISPGLAIGPVYFLENEIGEVPRRAVAPTEVEAEIDRLRDALREAEEQFRRQKSASAAGLTAAERGIFDAHLAFYQDQLLRDSVEKRVREQGLNAEAALKDEIDHLATIFDGMDRTFRERVADVRDVGNRVQRVLLQKQQAALVSGCSVVLYARELLPTDTLTLDRSRLLAIVTEVGGEASHVAILARSSGIPAVSGVRRLETVARPGTELAVDGTKGVVVVAPDAKQRAALDLEREAFAVERRRLLKAGAERSGAERERGVTLLLNIENFDNLDPGILQTCDGVGLYRTEFLFMGRQTFPSEEEQHAFYKDVLAHLKGREVTFRTIDVGGDKPLSYLVTPREQNPALGWRGIRLTFDWQDLLIPQLRALLRAAAHGPLKILLPMVTNVDELVKARILIRQLEDDLRRQKLPFGEKVPVGAMVEVPAAALAPETLLKEADFLSIGTNDLLQYLFAVDRNNLQVAGLYQPLHPVALALLRRVIEAGAKVNRPVTVCGEMAGELLPVLALYGLGLRRFSMAPVRLAEARTIFRHFTPDEAAAVVRSVEAATSEAEVEALLKAAALERVGPGAHAFLRG
ncbi:MAG TPA: phosphoenolpyruvate--protein phosphotransferase [Planctomycetota bacterium]|nr:phosphoenolpyruvate--protein phosphotransferase [Planctomycetota bacterium]